MTGIAGRRELTLGRARVSSYVAMLALGCVAGTYAGLAVAAHDGLNGERFVAATAILLVPALVGARLWYVATHLSRYRTEPRAIWRRADGGSALYGGLVLAVAASAPVLAVLDLPFRRFWDAAAVTMLVGLALTRVGCLMNGCCAGRETAGPLGMVLPDVRGVRRRRYPTQMLEAGWAVAVLVVVLAIRPADPAPGELFAAVVAGYAAGRLVLEAMRQTPDPRRTLAVNGAASAVLIVAAAAVLL